METNESLVASLRSVVGSARELSEKFITDIDAPAEELSGDQGSIKMQARQLAVELKLHPLADHDVLKAAYKALAQKASSEFIPDNERISVVEFETAVEAAARFLQGQPSGQPREGAGAKGYLSCSDLAEKHNLNAEALRKRLSRWRKNNGDGWVENSEGGSRKPTVLFQESAVETVISKLKKASGERPAKKKL